MVFKLCPNSLQKEIDHVEQYSTQLGLFPKYLTNTFLLCIQGLCAHNFVVDEGRGLFQL